MQSIASQIKELRVKKNLTQEELATLSGVSEGTVYFIETEAHMPNMKNLEAVAKALGCEIIIRRCADQKEKIKEVPHHLKIEPDEFELLASGRKNFLVRFDNNTYSLEGIPFEVGDKLLLREYDPRKINSEKYSGRECSRVVKYIEKDSPGLLNGYVVLGLAPEPESSPRSSDGERSGIEGTDCSWK